MRQHQSHQATMFTNVVSLVFLLPVIALGAQSEGTFNETIEGYKFFKSGPKALLPKIEYEMSAARTALSFLKDNLGPDGLIQTLQPEIKKADAFWKEVNAQSSGSWVPADGRAVAFLPNITAARFAYWTQLDLADKANNAANPEHYVKRTKKNADGTLESEILEGWGGVTTHFTIPKYGTPDRKKYPFLRELPEFPLQFQAAGDKVLMDGTVFGVLHISVRDIPGGPYGQSHDGIEVFASVWYGDGVKDEHLEDERTHITTEIINLTMQAQKDFDRGVYTPPF